MIFPSALIISLKTFNRAFGNLTIFDKNNFILPIDGVKYASPMNHHLESHMIGNNSSDYIFNLKSDKRK